MIIPLAHAVVHERAMVIEAHHAVVAVFAMRRTRRPHDLTRVAPHRRVDLKRRLKTYRASKDLRSRNKSLSCKSLTYKSLTSESSECVTSGSPPCAAAPAPCRPHR